MASQLSRIVVFGDSVTWGQGLLESEKFSTLVNVELAGGTAKLTTVAHSGAVIGIDLNPVVQPVPQEVPRPYPTILQQVTNFTDAPDTVDLLIINGGLNDLDIRYILNPLTDVHELVTLTNLYCHDHLMVILREVLNRCANAKVVVTGYFPILSDRSNVTLVHLFLHAHFINIPSTFETGISADFGVPRNLIIEKVVKLATTFWQESTAAIDRAVKDIANPRLAAAFAPFTAANAALADDPWLWGVTALLQPQDPMQSIRRQQCDAAETDPLKRFICHRASAGHPNVEGARRFAQAILRVYGRLSGRS